MQDNNLSKQGNNALAVVLYCIVLIALLILHVFSVVSVRQGETDTALLRSMSRCSDLELQVAHASQELLHVKQQYDMVLPRLSII